MVPFRRDPARLEAEPYDLLVVGGGIHGACAAWDAALRGLRTALIERDDFGGATSANSLKTVHGGLRLLRRGAIRLVRQAIRERRTWMRVAPHLVHPLPVLVPTSGGLLEGRAAFRAALTAHRWIEASIPVDPEDPPFPRSRVLGRHECLALFPPLNGSRGENVTGGALWYDAQVLDTERLTLAVLQAAAAAGSLVCNYAEATGFLEQGGAVVGVRGLDLERGVPLVIRARMVLNAAGPWSGGVAAMHPRVAGSPARRADGLALGWNLVLGRTLGAVAVGLRSKRTRGGDPAGEGPRFLFLSPWEGVTLAGTAYRVVDRLTAEPRVGAPDVHAFLEDVNDACPGLHLGLEDVVQDRKSVV